MMSPSLVRQPVDHAAPRPQPVSQDPPLSDWQVALLLGGGALGSLLLGLAGLAGLSLVV